VTQERTSPQSTEQRIPASTRLANSYYAILGLHPWASPISIRQAYRELSKRYHPDTTELPSAEATAKFQQLNEASRWNVIQPPSDLNRPAAGTSPRESSSAYLSPVDRPLSSGEIFVLFLLGVTFVGCLLLVVIIASIGGKPLEAVPLLNSLDSF
jgi:hypothetical protein